MEGFAGIGCEDGIVCHFEREADCLARGCGVLGHHIEQRRSFCSSNFLAYPCNA